MTLSSSIYKLFPAIIFASLWCLTSLDAQVVADKFGQNRLQFEQKKWFRYRSPSFAISYAKNDEQLAKYVLPVAEEDYQELTQLFEHELKKRIEIIIYSDYSDYAQSNIGQERHLVNQGGVTDIRSPKIRVYFDGNHNNLRKQLREGLASILLGKILAGTNLQEIVQNSVLMNLPKWFVQGAIAHATEDWNTARDNELRDVLLQGKYGNFVEFARKQPELAGHSLFHFVQHEHGPSTVSNLLYLTRINRSIENGFLYVFGKTFYQVAGTDWFNYYSSRYNSDNDKRRYPSKGEIDLKLRKQSIIKQVKISPDSKHLLYTEHFQGVRRVLLYNLETNKQKVLFKTGELDFTGDYERNYPLIDWVGNEQVAIFYEKRDKVRLRFQGVGESKKTKNTKIKEIERVTNFAVLGSKDLVFVGIKDGQSDLYRYKRGRISQITKDFWDEGEVVAAKIKGQRGLIFTSNRPRAVISASRFVNEMPQPSMDLFFYNLETKSPDLIQLTRTPLANERNPISINNQGNFGYLSDRNGFYNRYVGHVDSVLVRYERLLVFKDSTTKIVAPDFYYKDLPVDTTYLQPVYIETGVAHANTDYSRNILEHDKNSSKFVDLFYRNGAYHLFVRTARPERDMGAIKPTTYRQIMNRLLRKTSNKVSLGGEKNGVEEKETPSDSQPKELKLEQPTNDTLPPAKQDTGKIDIDNYEFQSDFEEVKEPEVKEDGTDDVTPTILVEEEDGDLQAKKQKKKKPIRLTEETTKVVEWERKYKRPYKSLFRVDQVTIQFDNTPMYNGMDMYLGNHYRFQPLGAAFKIGFQDIQEHFYVQLGVRLPVTFNGLEYFIDIENNKGLVDQRYSFYRRGRIENYVVTDTVNNISIEARGRTVKHLVETELKYPISKSQSIRGIFGVQLDKVAILAEDALSIQVPVYHENRIRARLEYVYDNTVSLRHNARKGTRFKGFIDLYKPFQVQTQEKFQVGFEGGLTTAIGFDARHYLTFDDKTIFAFRLAGASSFGQQKILYSLGGVENWMFTNTNNVIPLPNPQEFGLQTLAANMRGFGNNARNGSSYMVGNFEIRIPIVDYLSRNPPRNAMLRSLQFTAFLDIGTAWQGLSPFSADNPLNTSVVDNSGPNTVSPVKVTVNYFRRPILFGYGFGVRTVLLGHYFRLDYAWGVETGQVQKPMLYLSVGTDF